MNTNSPQLSLVVLCYKSGDRVRQLVAALMDSFKSSGIDSYELILVGNYVEGSQDSTPQVVKELAKEDSRIRCCALPKKGWMGWDMRKGFEMAQGQYIAVIDGDGQMPVEDAARVYQTIRDKRLDFVKTVRLTRGDSLLRKALSYFYNACFKLLFPGLEAQDINSKPKIMTRAVYQQLDLSADDWFIDAEIMIQVRRLKLKFAEIPTTFLGLTGRRSFIRIRVSLEFIKNLICYRIKEWGRRA